MPENLLCPNQRASTPAFREGWDRVFGKPIGPDFTHMNIGYRVILEKGLVKDVIKFREEK